jgi:hypothetical protein
MKLGDYLNAINHSKKPLMDTEDELVEKKYLPFIINRCLSYFPDTILQANEMNSYAHLDKKMQFDFLRHSIRSRKRFSKWLKNEKSEQLEAIKDCYGYSNQRADEVLSILTPEQIEHICFVMQRGGKHK